MEEPTDYGRRGNTRSSSLPPLFGSQVLTESLTKLYSMVGNTASEEGRGGDNFSPRTESSIRPNTGPPTGAQDILPQLQTNEDGGGEPYRFPTNVHLGEHSTGNRIDNQGQGMPGGSIKENSHIQPDGIKDHLLGWYFRDVS